MKTLKLYLDNCCFNRPYDDQTQLRIKLETEAKLYIQHLIKIGEVTLLWSYILEYENSLNPYRERAEAIGSWRTLAKSYTEATEDILRLIDQFESLNIKPKDAAHLACAVFMGADIFITTDDGILKKREKIAGITIFSPIECIDFLEKGADND